MELKAVWDNFPFCSKELREEIKDFAGDRFGQSSYFELLYGELLYGEYKDEYPNMYEEFKNVDGDLVVLICW